MNTTSTDTEIHTPAHWQIHPWMGVFAATLCAFHEDESLDEEGLRSYIAGLCAVDGLKGLVPNGHTGEIMALRVAERARVTRIVAEGVVKSGRTLKVISGVCGEGSLSAIDHALEAKEAGADGILIMPPHHWLRFGRPSAEAVGFIADVAEGSDISIVIHQYLASSRICLRTLASKCHVSSIAPVSSPVTSETCRRSVPRSARPTSTCSVWSFEPSSKKIVNTPSTPQCSTRIHSRSYPCHRYEKPWKNCSKPKTT